MLKDLKTNLKSLKFGKDLPGGGTSNQPYLVSTIPNDRINSSDFILNGGMIQRSKDDFVRISKFFTDNKSYNGDNFIIKQGLLSRTSPKTQSSNGIFNDGVYNPLSTLTQVGAVGFGIHLPKQTKLNVGNDINNSGYSAFVKPNQPISENRLIKIFKEETKDKVNIITYNGGPGSILGVGSTNIKYASNSKTGKNHSLGINGLKVSGVNNSDTDRSDIKSFNTTQSKGVSFIYGKKYPKIDLNDNYNSDGGKMWNDSVYIPNSFNPNLEKTLQNNTNTLTQDQLQEASNLNISRNTKSFIPKIQDFRQKLKSNIINNYSSTISDSPDYTTKNLNNRVNIGNPGTKKNVYKYGKDIPSTPLDLINFYPIYSSNNVKSENTNDLIKFRIQVINQGTGNGEKNYNYIHFRAFLNNISDNYNSDWQAKRYIGRGENYFNYLGFDRKISLSWTVAAQSKSELIPMYQKLNYLASTLAPNYNDNGFMMGTLVKLTIGGYLYEVTGFINSLTYDIQEDTEWEIGLDNEGNNDSSVKELPHIIRVNNFQFTPIHNFIPSLQKNTFGNDEVLNKFGDSRFISLEDGINNNNYNDIYKIPGKQDSLIINKKSTQPIYNPNPQNPNIVQSGDIYNINTNPIESPVPRLR